ncbi:oligosaccharide flippase family protein [Arthrobacter sp. NPDC056691]|uniref:oligosaccharide flippase family protein n=1 Tax=Arthrobacter sp. NPDC056691 TaxID=3345913 RepID=UPI00366D5EB1
MAIKQRNIATGALWTYGFSGLMLLIQVAYTFCAARLLTPADFGPYAIAVSAAQVASYFVGSGVIQAVLQAREDTRESRTAASTLVIGAGTIVAVLLSCLGIVFLGMPAQSETGAMILLLAWMPLLTGLSGIATASMRRSGNFRLPSATEAIGLFCGLALSLSCIVGGVGAVSLAIGSIATPVLTAATAWTSLREFPVFRLAMLRGNTHLRVAGHIAGQNLVHYIQYTLPLWSLGAVSSAADVGFYSRAQGVATIPLNQLSQAFTRVIYPHLADARHTGTAVGSAIAKSMTIAIAISAVVFGTICGVAEPLTLSFLGAQWTPAIPLTALWSVFAAINLCYVAAGSALESQAEFSHIWRIQMLAIASMLLALLLVFAFGMNPLRVLIAAVSVQVVAHAAQLVSLTKLAMISWRSLYGSYIYGTVLFIVVSGIGLLSSQQSRSFESPFMSLTIGGCLSALAAIAFIFATYWTEPSRCIRGIYRMLRPMKVTENQ